MTTRQDKLNQALRSLSQASADIIGSAILTSDGFVVTSMLPSEVDEELVAGLAATLLGIGEQVASAILSSNLEQTYVRSEKGYVIVNAVSENEVLILLATRKAKLGFIFLEVRRCAKDLEALL